MELTSKAMTLPGFRGAGVLSLGGCLVLGDCRH
jgi:hypothetical protein